MSPKLLNILLILIPISLYYGYIDPMYTGAQGLVWTPESSIGSLKSQKVQYENAINQVDLIGREAGKLNKDYDSIDQELKDKVTMMLPDSIDPIKLRSEVVAISNKSDVAITGLKVTEGIKIPKPDLAGYRVAFSVRAHYAAIKKLLENYERSRRFFVIDSINIERYEKKDNDPNAPAIDDNEMLQATIAFEVYYLTK